MPTNRNRKSRNRFITEPWMEQYLLEVRAEHSVLPNQKSIRPYCWSKELGGCLCHEAIWLPLWEELKGDILPAWRKQHPGELCFAEKQIIAAQKFEAELLEEN